MLPTIASSLVSGIFGVGQQNQILKQQKEENELAFQRNMQLAQQQNAMNVAQWHRANEYDLPINQIKRLKQAGLSPALMYKNGTSGLTASASPTMSSGDSYNPVDMTISGNRKTIGDVMQNTINNSLLSAQAELLKAQADKTRSETKGINISNDVNEQLLYAKTDAEIKEILSSTNLNDKQVDLVVANIDKFKKECDVFDATIKEKLANIDDMSFKQFRSMLDYKLQKSLNEATINKLNAETSFTKMQIKQIAETLPYVLSKFATEIASIQAGTALTQQEKLLIMEQITTEVAKRANIDANTAYTKAETAYTNSKTSRTIAENYKIEDQAARYNGLWGINKDILFVIDSLISLF